ncbi:DivIVA domain-containing protein [Vescimonas sp.]|uniref:DivIVA domain-containing protein n=1 Tax=Vescimonas sp. TaxID=2892404 RepID=UPI0030793568
MFTPQEVSEKTFPKSSSFSSGYDLAAVDEFLDTLTEDYTALYKENAALKAKLKILAEKLEEYRATEDTMRSMLLAAQKMAASMTDEAKEKSEKMLAEARSQREQILEEAQNAAAVANRDFQQKTEAARQKLSAAEEAMKDYVAKSLALCRTQTQFLEQLPHSDLPAQESAEAQETVPAAQAAPAKEAAPTQETLPTEEAAPAQETVPAQEAVQADEPRDDAPTQDTVRIIGKDILSAYEKQQAPEPDHTLHPDTDFVSEFKLDLDELKFGRNYDPEKN